MVANLNYSQRKGSFVTCLFSPPWVFEERNEVREVRMMNSTWTSSPFWRKWFPDECLGHSSPIKPSWFHHNRCGCLQMRTEGCRFLQCSLLLPFSLLCRVSPSGPFLLLPLASSPWPAGPLAAVAAGLLSKCERQTARSFAWWVDSRCSQTHYEGTAHLMP